MNLQHFQDEQDIKAVLAKYLEGSSKGDSSILKPCFHKDAVLYWDGADTDAHSHAIQWFFDAIDRMGPDDDEHPMSCVNVLSITDGIAVVQVGETWKGMAYTDYMSMIRTPEGWKIASKLFHNHSADLSK